MRHQQVRSRNAANVRNTDAKTEETSKTTKQKIKGLAGGRLAAAVLTSITRLSRVAAVALAVRLPQARHPAPPVSAVGDAAGVSSVPVLVLTQDSRMTRLAAAGVGEGVDGETGAVDTPGGGETGPVKVETHFEPSRPRRHSPHPLVAVTGVVDLLVAQRPRPAGVARAREAPMPCGVTVSLEAGASLTRLAARLHPLAQPLPGAAPGGGRPGCPRSPSSCQVLQLPVDVQVTQAAVETGTVASCCPVLQRQTPQG